MTLRSMPLILLMRFQLKFQNSLKQDKFTWRAANHTILRLIFWECWEYMKCVKTFLDICTGGQTKFCSVLYI